MAVTTVYKAGSSYKDPNTGSIYLDGAGGKSGSSANNNVTVGAAPSGSSTIVSNAPTANTNTTVSSSSSSSGSNNQYTRSDKVNNYFKQAEGYASDLDGMEFTPSDYLNGYKNKLSEVEAAKPGPFQSKYTDTINSLLDSILNEKSFSYTGQDMMNDDMYKMYSEMYEHNARKAMQDAMGNAAALTGGYGSTYSQAAGQQAYDEQMSGMNDIALQLADRAYQQYLNDRQNRYNQMNTVTGLDDTDYGRYRDEVGDWQLDRSYYAGRYDDTYNQEYGAYRDSVGDLQYLANYFAGLGDTEADNELNAWNSNESMREFEQNYLLNQNADQREQEEWDLRKQLLELQLANAQAGGGSSGGSPSSKQNNNDSTKNTKITMPELDYTLAQLKAPASSSDAKTAKEAKELQQAAIDLAKKSGITPKQIGDYLNDQKNTLAYQMKLRGF